MRDFTVIGFWPDTDQRFATHITAKNASEAETICTRRHKGVLVCGVIHGEHICADTDLPLVRTELNGP